MTAIIERRVARLEESTGGAAECPECGLGPEDDKDPYEIVFVDSDEATPDEWCETCGRSLHITIHFEG
jgi:hypothetical protein